MMMIMLPPILVGVENDRDDDDDNNDRDDRDDNDDNDDDIARLWNIL